MVLEGVEEYKQEKMSFLTNLTSRLELVSYSLFKVSGVQAKLRRAGLNRFSHTSHLFTNE